MTKLFQSFVGLQKPMLQRDENMKFFVAATPRC